MTKKYLKKMKVGTYTNKVHLLFLFLWFNHWNFIARYAFLGVIVCWVEELILVCEDSFRS